MHSRTHYAQKTTPARLPLTPRCVLWTALLFVGACGQPETSSRSAEPAAGASPGLADRLTARGAEVQADGEGNITLLNLYWTDLTDDDLPLLGGLHQLRTLILPVRATTAGLRHLKGLTALAELYPPNEITDAGSGRAGAPAQSQGAVSLRVKDHRRRAGAFQAASTPRVPGHSAYASDRLRTDPPARPGQIWPGSTSPTPRSATRS